MSDPTVLNALVTRRAEMMARMHTAQAELQQMHADLAALDSVIQQIDPEYRLDAIRPRYRRAAAAPELASISRAVLDTLRRSGGPMTAKDIAGKVMEARGLNLADPKLRRQMNKRVDMALRYQRTNGMVREVV
ncbi:hypothetical protein, partial [Rhodopila sp.]|uniref:hypothetical protein n=1 Tax=Rhodopila sp. TaxID=2480087 RepID=UPI002D7F7C74